MTGSSQAQDRPLFGIALMLGFCILAPIGDAMAKVLGQSIPILHIVTVRFCFQAAILVPFVLLAKRPLWGNRRIVGLTIIRTVLHILGIGAMFTSLRYLPLADAVAIAFVMPFIMLILGKTFLGETVGPHRIWACVFGFVGTLLVVQPNFIEVGLPALLPLFVAVVFALFMLVTRKIAKEVDPIGLQASSGLIAIAILVPATILAPALGLNVEMVMPSSRQFALLAAMGALGSLAHLLMTWSLKFAPSATLAPMQYLEIPFATLIGLIVFADLPNGMAAVGIVITVVAGLYVILRERKNALTTAPSA